jgi:hypothetical protein
MASVSLSVAARLTGRNRSTLFRAIEKGQLSASRNGQGRITIDPAELERVYGTLRNPDADNSAGNDVQWPEAADGNSAALLREIELLREMLATERAASREAVERERAILDHERRSFEEERTFLRGMLEKQAEQVKLLTDQREREPVRSPSLWARLFRINA